MKPKLDVWQYLLNVYAMFQIDISKHVEKSPENFAKSKTRKNIRQNSEMRLYLDLWGHDCKIWVWPTFGCKLCQIDAIVMKLELDISCHLPNAYTKYQIDISKHIEKRPENSDGRTDGQSAGQTNRRTDIARA